VYLCQCTDCDCSGVQCGTERARLEIAVIEKRLTGSTRCGAHTPYVTHLLEAGNGSFAPSSRSLLSWHSHVLTPQPLRPHHKVRVQRSHRSRSLIETAAERLSSLSLGGGVYDSSSQCVERYSRATGTPPWLLLYMLLGRVIARLLQGDAGRLLAGRQRLCMVLQCYLDCEHTIKIPMFLRGHRSCSHCQHMDKQTVD